MDSLKLVSELRLLGKRGLARETDLVPDVKRFVIHTSHTFAPALIRRVNKLPEVFVPPIPLVDTGRACTIVIDDVALGVSCVPVRVQRPLELGWDPVNCMCERGETKRGEFVSIREEQKNPIPRYEPLAVEGPDGVDDSSALLEESGVFTIV